ncbi:MAG TPA: hybrid sensor histidine kinase/response regulator [Ferrovibrio sp.]|uniref:hybrid sensor histidine kinase/response regulator n=1 Tax=Ferrovibrio sp. TaxID=1917215 RepID=UPI002ED1EA83
MAVDKDRLAKRLLATFRTELQEHCGNLERGLLELEACDLERRQHVLESLFRTAHSLKGAARSVNVELVEHCCHWLEEVFGAERRGTIHIDNARLELCLKAADAIRDAGLRLEREQDLSSGPLPVLLPQLAAMASDAKASPQRLEVPAARPKAASEPAATDMAVRLLPAQLDALSQKSTNLVMVGRRPLAQLDRMADLIDRVRQRRLDRGLRGTADRPAAPQSVAAGTTEAAPAGGSRLRRDLIDLEKDLQAIVRVLTEDLHDLGLAISELDGDVQSIRMSPFSEACERLPRVLRDLAAATGKKVELILRGEDVRVDRTILQRLRDPLLHMVRNAVSHGIESPEVRAAAGKPATGRITVSARLRGSTVEIMVGDDGAGLDFSKIREHARAQAIPEVADERGLAETIFLSGFSTASAVSRISGRGVGLDVVKSEVEAMRGVVAVETESGRGTRFILSLPLTLSTVRGLLVQAGNADFAIDTFLVSKILRLPAGAVLSAQGRSVLQLDGKVIPVASLADLLGLPKQGVDRTGKLAIVVLASAQGSAAIIVDGLNAERELVVQALDWRLQRSSAISAAAVLPDGSIALLLNAAELIAAARASSAGRTALASYQEEAGETMRRILVVDDSITTRTLEQNILEAAGYEVILASDGLEAWHLLQERAVDLIVSDIEMPRMDGFALTEAVRSSPRLSGIPIVLVTALASEDHRLRGMQAGADAYLVKSAFDQETLLDAVRQVL